MGCDRISACEALLQGSPLQQAGGVRMLRELAKGSEVRAMHALGVAFQEGLGVPVDPAEAGRWYRAAADAGHAPSARNLGILYQVGLGLPKDAAEAARRYASAAEAGDAVAAYNLAALLEEEPALVAQLELAEAAFWYRRAAKLGHAEAHERVKWLGESPSAPVPLPSRASRAAASPPRGLVKSDSLWRRLLGQA